MSRWQGGIEKEALYIAACCVDANKELMLVGVYGGFFISIFFISVFYKKIFSIWKIIEIYPGCRAAGTWPPGSRAAGAYSQKKKKKNCRQVLGAGRPAAGRPAPPGRPAAGRPAPTGRPTAGRPALPPYIRVSWSPTPHLHHYNSRKKKREGGRERGEALPDFRAGDRR